VREQNRGSASKTRCSRFDALALCLCFSSKRVRMCVLGGGNISATSRTRTLVKCSQGESATDSERLVCSVPSPSPRPAARGHWRRPAARARASAAAPHTSQSRLSKQGGAGPVHPLKRLVFQWSTRPWPCFLPRWREQASREGGQRAASLLFLEGGKAWFSLPSLLYKAARPLSPPHSHTHQTHKRTSLSLSKRTTLKASTRTKLKAKKQR
jgi:hypothetical protein